MTTKSAHVWELDSGRSRPLPAEAYPSFFDDVALTTDGRLGLLGTTFPGTGLFDLECGTRLRTFDTEASSVALTRDGRLALTGTHGGSAQLWEVETGRCLHELAGGCVWVALTPDGRLGLTAGGSTGLIWELAAGHVVQELRPPQPDLRTYVGHIVSVALTADGRLALIGSYDRSARLWDVDRGTCVHNFEGHMTPVTSVALSANGHIALTCGSDGSVQVWELDWDYEFPAPADWHEAARPALEEFLYSHVPYAEPLTSDGPLRVGTPAWNDEDLDGLMRNLEDAGYGWLRPEGVRRELERMTAEGDG